MEYFCGYTGAQWELWKKLAFELVHPWDTDWVDETENSRRTLRSINQHELVSVPIYYAWTDRQ